MSDVAVRVEGLGKKYRLGVSQQAYGSLRETLSGIAHIPLRVASGVAFRGSAERPPRRPDFWALKDVGFEVKHGEALGIIGRNGAGKSTLLKLLSEITEPTEGRIAIRGRVASLLEVGTGFHPELSGRENIYLNGAILGMTRAEIVRKFDEIVAFAEVEQFIDTQVKHYSSGMYLRLAFSVAAHLEPEILIVDEVLAVGDAEFQKKCVGKMGDVARHGRTVLFVSHNMAAMSSLCGRAILLDRGRIAAGGSPEAVIEAYLYRREAGLDSEALPLAGERTAGAGKRLYSTDADGRVRMSYKIREPWDVHLEFEMYARKRAVIAALGIQAKDGTPIITTWSEPQDLEPGTYKAVFHFNTPLANGDLQFAVGLSSREGSMYYVDGISGISISDIAVGEQPLSLRGTGLLVSNERPLITPLDQQGTPWRPLDVAGEKAH